MKIDFSENSPFLHIKIIFITEKTKSEHLVAVDFLFIR